MKILIVEDEKLLAKELRKMLLSIEPAASICGMTQSVQETVHWLKHNNPPDLVLMDIELADGQSFDIIKLVQLDVPVIFTTAYDEFAIKAFKVNSVDYLLKPIQENELKAAIEKFKKCKEHQSVSVTDLMKKIEQLSERTGYRNRFLIKQGQKMMSIDISDVAYFFSENKCTFIRTFQNQKYILDIPLDDLEEELPPQQFFRANRQCILSGKAVVVIHSWFNQKLKVELNPSADESIIISRDKANGFKAWMGE